MGSYLSEPVTDKVSGDDENDKLSCGHSSMQGWRVTQEDAHNCILDFDSNTALFAVYDGHGGPEVAKYSSSKLPEFIKNTEAYKAGDMEKALVDAFLGFDATIAKEEVINILKEIAGDRECAEESDDVEDSVDHLYEEAAMPIEEVIEKYKSNLIPAISSLKAEKEKQPNSPYLKARRDCDDQPGSSSSGHKSAFASCSSSSQADSNDAVSSSSNIKAEANGSETKSEDPSNSNERSDSGSYEISHQNGEAIIPKLEETPDSSGDKKTEECQPSDEKSDTKTSHQNGDLETSENSKGEDVSSTCSPHENGEVPKKGKGKALAKTKGAIAPVKPKRDLRPKASAQHLYKTLLDFEDASDEDSEDDEEDVTFEGPPDSDDSDESETGDKTLGDSEDDKEEDEEEEEEEYEEEDELGESEDMEDCDEFARNMREEPGSDSGCTAVVALLRGTELYVANAGDSRCIVCRNGSAVEMSFDHKPEDEPERERVVKAGGKVTSDGRVNGGLNLSRAIGDHAYKQNKELTDREQMITALPDIRKITINPGEDEFMVLACDGIWNFMSSQEVVDFVRPRLQEKVPLSKICEEMFDHCLAPNTLGDGTGCDNMTAIIVQFKSNILKRPASSDDIADNSSKRAKTEETVQVESSA